MAKESNVNDVSGREHVVTRLVNAPRDLVFQAWTEPKHLQAWWGPDGFTTTSSKVEIKEGGEWIFIMHGPDGRGYGNKIVYREIRKPERIAYDHVGLGKDDEVNFKTVVTFHTQGDKTLVTMRGIFPSAEVLKQLVKERHADEGGNQTMDRMVAHVASMAHGSPKHRLVITRILNAPREKVFDAFVNEKTLAKWWGPDGFTNPVCKADARPGGKIYIEMTGPDGTKYPMEGSFKEVARPERLSFYSIAFQDAEGSILLEGLNSLSFYEQEGKTRLTLQVEIVKFVPGRVEGALSGMEAGWSQSLDRLANIDLLDRQLVLMRLLDAPRSVVWNAWTDAKALGAWWGPKGFKMKVVKLDLRSGGQFHYSMESPDGKLMWGKFVYGEFAAPERLEWVNCFSDEKGTITRNPWLATWPLQVSNQLTLYEMAGKTVLTLRGYPVNANAAEIKAFEEGRKSMEQGFAGTFAQLEEYLASLQRT